MSWVYILKIVATYGGALITAVGLWIYIPKFYNILCKKRYRYPKDFTIRVGDENTVKNVCNLVFVSEEVKASKIILDKIKKRVAQELEQRSISDKDLIAYFSTGNSDYGQLDENSILNSIKREMTNNKHVFAMKRLLRTELVDKLIINQLTLIQLNLADLKLTKKVFNSVKDDWGNLVEKNRDNSLKFELNKDKLAQKLQALGIQFKPTQEVSESLLNASNKSPVSEEEIKSIDSLEANTPTNPLENGLLITKNSSRETSLINNNQKDNSKPTALSINFNVLEKAILAHVFAYHHLDVNRADVKVEISRHVSSTAIVWNKLKSFVKKDLYRVEFVGGSDTLYGIKFAIQEAVLHLSGAPEADLENETLVVQIVNRRGAILRELWLNCLTSDLTEEEEGLTNFAL